MITQTYNIDLVPNGKPLIVNVSQYDKLSRTLEFNVYNSGVLFEIPSGTAAVIQGTKLDGTGFSYNMTVSGSKVSMNIEQQMTVFDGDVHCEILLTKNAEQLGSANFILRVEKAAISDETIISETDIPIFRSFASGGTNGQVFVHGEGDEGNWGNLNATNIETSSDVAIKSVSGNPVTIADALQGKALGVNTTLEPIQDLHGYDHPWAGGANKQLINIPDIPETTQHGVTYSIENGVLNINGTCTGGFSPFGNLTVDFPSNTYTFSAQYLSGSTSGVNNSFSGYNSSSQRKWLVPFGVSSQTVKVTQTSDVNRITVAINNGAVFDNAKIAFQVEQGSNMTEFVPYSNICPISGRTQVDVLMTGKNIIPFPYSDGSSSAYGLTRTVSDDGKITITGTTTRGTNFFLARSIKLKAGTYTLSISGVHEGMLLIARNTDTSTNLLTIQDSSSSISASFTTETDISQFNLYFNVSYADKAVDISAYVQLELGSIATEYESYTGQSVTVQLGQTVYGGTLDVTTGLLTVDKGYVDLGTLDYVYDGIRFYAILPDAEPLENKPQPNAISSKYAAVTIYSDGGNGKFFISRSKYLSIWDSAYTDAVTFKTAMSGVQLCYELATPQTIKLTPAQINLLTGTNIISTNADDLSVMYYATGKGDVEGSLSFLLDKTAKSEMGISSLAGSLAMIETSPATTNHAVGDLIVYNNQLYEVTVAIATGETLKVGTNISATTVGGELTSPSTQYNWTSYLSSSEQDSSAAVTAMVTHNIVVLSIRTKSTTHVEDGVIMTIPEGFRPIANIHAVGKVGSHELCTVSASTNGRVSIWSMTQSSVSGRFVCQVVYVYR